MMKALHLLLLSLFVALVICEVDVQLNSFEGAYTSINGRGPGFGLWLCQDGDVVQGSFDEVGILIGSVSDDGKTLSGSFFIAGRGPCVRGTFQFDQTTDGFTGFYTCQFQEGNRAWDAQRTSIFRPPDSQCALLYKPDTLDLEGEWIDTSNTALNIDICFIDPDDDDETVKASLQHRTSAGVIEDWFIAGTWYNNGKIVQGTWYTDLNAGAILMFLRDTGNIDYFWWTGLVFDSGQTYIDYLQLGDITNHGRGTFKGPRAQIVYEDCSKYEVLEKYVKVNLPRDDDDNYYYFVQTYYLDHYLFNYLVPDASTTLAASLIVIIAGLIAVLI